MRSSFIVKLKHSLNSLRKMSELKNAEKQQGIRIQCTTYNVIKFFVPLYLKILVKCICRRPLPRFLPRCM